MGKGACLGALTLSDSDFRFTLALQCRYAADLNNPRSDAGKTNGGSIRKPARRAACPASPGARSHAARADRACRGTQAAAAPAAGGKRRTWRYSPELHQAFLDAGLYRTVQPRMFGGYEFDIPTFYRAMLEISHGHPSAGWCLTLCASHPFLIASHWSEEAQRELFGTDGHFAAPHRVPPSGTLTPVDGGYRLTGQWDFCSGIPYSTHLVCGALLPRRGRSAGGFLCRRTAQQTRHSRRLGRRPNAGHAGQRIEQRRDQGRLRAGASCRSAAGACSPGRKICATARRERDFMATRCISGVCQAPIICR